MLPRRTHDGTAPLMGRVHVVKSADNAWSPGPVAGTEKTLNKYVLKYVTLKLF